MLFETKFQLFLNSNFKGLTALKVKRTKHPLMLFAKAK